MPVEVNDRTGQAPARCLERAACSLLKCIGKADCNLDVLVVDDAVMRDLNKIWRAADRPTDVLSFAQLEGRPLAGATLVHLGDIVISLDSARRQADAGGWTVEEEMTRLLLHGLLHLVGYDHEASAQARQRMKQEEKRLARALIAAGIPCAGDEERP